MVSNMKMAAGQFITKANGFASTGIGIPQTPLSKTNARKPTNELVKTEIETFLKPYITSEEKDA